MHVEPIETLRDLREQYGTKILYEKQFALQKADLGLRTKRVPAHQGSWTVPCCGNTDSNFFALNPKKSTQTRKFEIW
jgi:hypothetical protein